MPKEHISSGLSVIGNPLDWGRAGKKKPATEAGF